MKRTRIALSIGLLVIGGLLVAAAVPALAQSTGGMPRHEDGTPMALPTMTAIMGSQGMGMHGQVSPDLLAWMQHVHGDMPAALREQTQAWYQQQGVAGMMVMMGGQGPAAMPQELRDQMRAYHAQLPADVQAQLPAMHASMAAVHGGQVPADCPLGAGGAADPSSPPADAAAE